MVELLSNRASYSAHHGIGARIIGRGTAKDIATDGGLLDFRPAIRQNAVNNIGQKGAARGCDRKAGKDRMRINCARTASASGGSVISRICASEQA